jgi:hypothetical protein
MQRAVVAGLYTCPQCQSLYHVIRSEAGYGTIDNRPTIDVNRELSCQICSVPMPSREDDHVVRYYLLRKEGRLRKWGTGPYSKKKTASWQPAKTR